MYLTSIAVLNFTPFSISDFSMNAIKIYKIIEYKLTTILSSKIDLCSILIFNLCKSSYRPTSWKSPTSPFRNNGPFIWNSWSQHSRAPAYCNSFMNYETFNTASEKSIIKFTQCWKGPIAKARDRYAHRISL